VGEEVNRESKRKVGEEEKGTARHTRGERGRGIREKGSARRRGTRKGDADGNWILVIGLVGSQCLPYIQSKRGRLGKKRRSNEMPNGPDGSVASCARRGQPSEPTVSCLNIFAERVAVASC
jgi:hypothetical protein